MAAKRPVAMSTIGLPSRVGPLSSVDDRFAWDEGEGDRIRGSWLADHERFFRRYLPTIGVEFSADLPTVFERFEVLYAE